MQKGDAEINVESCSFSLHFRKNKPLIVMFSNPNSCDIFY